MSTKPDDQLNLTAGLLAIVFPGAGHLYLRQTRRGVLAAVGVLGLFLGGMLIGGVDVIDRQEDKWWFLGQAIVGPVTFAVDYYHQHALKAYPLDSGEIASNRVEARRFAALKPATVMPGKTRKVGQFQVFDGSSGAAQQTLTLPYAAEAGPGQGPPNTKAIGRMNELGMLSTTVAGMLNFIIILDALFPALAAGSGVGGRK